MMTVSEALKKRTSIRAFTERPVPLSLLREVLDVARYAPSGGNLQPWRVIAVTGAARDEVIALAQRVLAANPDGEAGDRPIYPSPLWEPYRTRRYALGEAMYELLGISRDDKAGRLQRFHENYRFFGAPVALFFVTDQRMGHGQWAHLGMFMQSVALAATERRLSTCMQESWGTLRKSLAEHFGLGPHDLVYCAMALGYADPEAPVNQLRSERASVDEIARFEGF